MNAEARFWSKVEKTETCWLWTGAMKTKNYGSFWLDGKDLLAHRVVWEFVHGPIESGLEVHHVCGVGSCVNPEHLDLRTAAEHWVETRETANGIGAVNSRKTHCIHGHPLSGRNLYIDRRGRRSCKECDRLRKRASALALTLTPSPLPGRRRVRSSQD